MAKKNALIFLLLGLGLFAARQLGVGQNAPIAVSERVTCPVLKVIDGDTFVCDLNHNNRPDYPQEKIRMLGIDTPESKYGLAKRLKHSVRAGQRYSSEATAFTTAALAKAKNHAVLVWDVSRQDPYGRSLAYVYPGAKAQPAKNTKTLNQALLEAGLAKSLFYDPNTALKAQFLAAEASAKSRRVGLWAR
ncbi:MAG: thermonuclease family protein [Vampirovibrionales bacterium]|nr:thermonuclease family protein [Vampirovibrionales bacterium]